MFRPEMSKAVSVEEAAFCKLVARLGFEPRQTAPEAAVLPLHHRAGWNMKRERGYFF